MLDAPGPTAIDPAPGPTGGGTPRRRRGSVRALALLGLLLVDVLIVVTVVALLAPGSGTAVPTATTSAAPSPATATAPAASGSPTTTPGSTPPGPTVPSAVPATPSPEPTPSVDPTPVPSSSPSVPPSAPPATAAPTPTPPAASSTPSGPAATLAPSAPALPPPPPAFVPASIRWYGDAHTGRWQQPGVELWTSGLDGSGLRRVSSVVAGPAVILPGERVAYAVQEPGQSPVLYLDRPDAEPTSLLDGVDGLVRDPTSEAVYVGRSAYGLTLGGSVGPVADQGSWRVPADGGPPTLVLPPVREAPGPRRHNVVSADGRSIASGVTLGDSSVRIQAAFAGSPPRLLPTQGRPLGFDDAGRLILLAPGGIAAETATGPAASPFRGLVIGGDDGVSMPDGRHVIVVRGPVGTESTTVEAHRLDGAPVQTWSLPGRWVLTDLGGGRHVVLESRADEVLPDGWHAVIELHERWLGYVAPIRLP